MQQLLDTFKTALETAGGEVKFARDYSEAIEIVRDICRLKEIKSAILAGALTTQGQIKSALSAEQIQVSSTSDLKSPDGVRIVEGADLGITDAMVGVADTGTVILITHRELDRLASALPPIHIVLLERNRIVGSLDEAPAVIEIMSQKPNYTLSFITGPSSTADIEQILVRGVHGPHSLYVVILG